VVISEKEADTIVDTEVEMEVDGGEMREQLVNVLLS
jgi:hypothetical protein